MPDDDFTIEYESLVWPFEVFFKRKPKRSRRIRAGAWA